MTESERIEEMAKVIHHVLFSFRTERCQELATALHNANFRKVVRCKDCKYWQDNNGGYPHEECKWNKDETPDADDYCSFGEQIR